MWNYSTLRPLLFRFDAELSHELAHHGLRTLQNLPWLLSRVSHNHRPTDPVLRQQVLGLNFDSPVGLAAGFDKNGCVVPAMAALGFGFLEVGSVTPKPQAGNPRPRLFRFIDAHSIQNAMGFNNAGMEAVRKNLTAIGAFPVPVGVNLGKSKHTPQEHALDDYITLITSLAPVADYLVINISSPNTPGLRDLQNESFVTGLFLQAGELTGKPVLLKLAPDMDAGDALRISKLAIDSGAAGIIATNTTTDYSVLPGARHSGGISGRALREKSFALFAHLADALFGRATLISVGGIESAEEVYRRIRAGASLVQIYSALIFEGPDLIRRINGELAALLKRDGFASVAEAVGADRQHGHAPRPPV